MHVLPAKHSYVWLPRKRDYRTDTHTDRRQTKWSLCIAMLLRRHKKYWSLNRFFGLKWSKITLSTLYNNIPWWVHYLWTWVSWVTRPPKLEAIVLNSICLSFTESLLGLSELWTSIMKSFLNKLRLTGCNWIKQTMWIYLQWYHISFVEPC